jgi:hypothetical protein
MGHQQHDIGRRKLADAQAIQKAKAKATKRGGKRPGQAKKRPPARYANWCRVENHPSTCSCAY